MGNIIIIGILVVIVLVALFNALKHFKGEGGCCGGGGTIKENKKLNAPKIGEKEIHIEGMHCDNCKKRVERVINDMEGAACKVNLKKKTAKVELSDNIDNDVIKKAVENLGFRVMDIIDR